MNCNMLKEDYVSFETAKLLKEKGFDENTPVNYFVGDDKPRGCAVGEMIYHKRLEEDTHLIACPTLQMAMKWLRNEKNIDILFDISAWRTYDWYYIFEGNRYHYDEMTFEYQTFEEAADNAIKYCLENLI